MTEITASAELCAPGFARSAGLIAGGTAWSLVGRVGPMTRAVSGYCEAAGARIYYEVEGEGEPVLFIHAGVANLRMWDQQAAALGDR